MNTRNLVTIGVVTWVLAATTHAFAQESRSCAEVNQLNLIPCALAASPAVQAERWGEAAAKGQLTAASGILPSNPVLGLTARRRTEDSSNRTATNWSASLSQEIEFAGQRGARREMAAAEMEAQRWRTTATLREVAASAWIAYFEVLSAREEQQAALRLEAISTALQRTTSGRAAQGIGTPIDADIAELSAVRAMQSRAEAQRHLSAAELTLGALLGRSPAAPSVQVAGDLVPPSGVLDFARSAATHRAQSPEIAMLDAERHAQSARAKAFRRARVPNVTLSVFAEQDGFGEHIVGLGVEVPLPVPHPFGKTYAGEIEEAEALAQRSASEGKLQTQNVRSGLAIALMDFESRRQELAAFTPERFARTEQTLQDITTEIEQGHVTVRDALLTQQTLIDAIQSQIEARRALCISAVRLALAAGYPFERGVK